MSMTILIRNGYFVIAAAYLGWFSLGPLALADMQQGLNAVHAKNYAEALAIFQTHAEAGDLEAQYNLAILLREGLGTEKDYTEAAKWFRKASDQGLADAQYNLGNLYELGLGVKQSYEYAAVWYKKAAEQGYAIAQTNLGVLYANGQGVTQDIVLAYVWSNLAASQGVAAALENREIIATELSEEMKGRVKSVSREYFQRYVAPFQSQRPPVNQGRVPPPEHQ
ncbi:tetratricopeptide repeat protein [Kaarinaea lacus]